MISRFIEIYKYRNMLLSFVKKDLRTRYKGSFLGFLWTFVNPLMQLIVYSLIFPFVLRFDIPNYAVFLFVALVPWIYFSSTLVGGCSQIFGQSGLVTKIYFPREIIPLTFALGGLCNMFFAYLIIFPMLFVFGIPLTANLLWLPLLFIIQAVLCCGLALMVSAVYVYFRDIEHILSICTLALQFLTPVIYDITMLPEKMQPFIKINPMTLLVLNYRNVVFQGVAPNPGYMAVGLATAVAVFFMGMLVFNKLQRGFAEAM
jgi:ABC-2 type transport system permease protein